MTTSLKTGFASFWGSLTSLAGRFGVKKGASFPFDQVSGLGGEGDRLRNPYSKSTWVMRAIKKVAGPIAAVPLNFTTDQRGGDVPVEDSAFQAWWQSPAEGLTRYDFIEATVGWLKLKGEAFWLLDDEWLMPWPGQMPSKIVVARPDRMTAILSDGKLAGWRFIDGGGRKHDLLPEQVIQPKFWNPMDSIRGQSEMEPAMEAAEADYLAGKFNANMMRNNGDAGAYVIAKSGIPTTEQREQIINQLRMKREMSLRGQFRPAFLTGDITVEDPKIQAPDASFTAVRLQNRHEIFIAFGVPPSMADIVASYSVGSASDRFILLEETCMPLAEKLADHLEYIATRLLRKPCYAYFDFDEHSVMQQVRRERLDSGAKLWTMGMPAKQISDYLRLDLPEFEGWDVGYLPFSVAPVGSLEMSTPHEDPAKSPEYTEEVEEPVDAMLRALQAGRTKARNPRETAAWRQLMGLRRGTSKAYQSRINRELMKARGEVLAKLAKHTNPGGKTKAAAADFLFDLMGLRTGLTVGLRGVAARALQTAGEQLYKEINRDDPFAYPPEAVLRFHQLRENKMKNVADEVFGQIQTTIEEGLMGGESTAKIAARVRAEFNDISKERSMRIAMTETSAAYGQGRQEAMVQAGIKLKRWLTSGNDNVRPAHMAANGQTVEIDKAFSVDGEDLMHPGDPNGSAGNVINCHCVSIPVEE